MSRIHIFLGLFLFCGGWTFAEITDSPTPATTKQDILKLPPSDAYTAVYKIWADGDQARAESLLESLAVQHPNHQPISFFNAACTRSRFFSEKSSTKMKRTVDLGPNTPEGVCAGLVLQLDRKNRSGTAFSAFRLLVDAYPDKALIRWMFAVQCRAYNSHEEGIDQYHILLKQLPRGSSMVHQTFANILDQVGLFEEALPHRRLAVQLEEKMWSVHGLANTLFYLEQYNEAITQYQRAFRLDPNDADALSGVGRCWATQNDHLQAMTFYQNAVQLDPKSIWALELWGASLWSLERYDEALEKYLAAIRAGSRAPLTYDRATQLYERTGKIDEALKMKSARQKIESVAK